MSPISQQFKHEKKPDQVSNSAQHGHQQSNKEEEQSLHQDLSKRIKIQEFSFCHYLDLNNASASVSLLLKWECFYFLIC